MRVARDKLRFAFGRLNGLPLRADGYSLLEMILAILLMSTAIPGIVAMYTGVMTNSHDAEFMTVSNMLAVHQMEIILADKAGSGEGYGYDSIINGRYASVDPGSPFEAWSRTVDIQTVNQGQEYEYKEITVTVTHPLIPPIELTAFVMDHAAL